MKKRTRISHHRKDTSRRGNHFLQFIFIAGMLLLVFASVSVVTKKIPFTYFSFAQQESSKLVTHGPLVGAVTDSSAVVWVRAMEGTATPIPGPESVVNSYVRVATTQESLISANAVNTPESANVSAYSLEKVQKVDAVELPWDYTWKSKIDGLTANTVYFVDIVIDGQSQLSPPYPKFKTFPIKGQNVAFKVAILTDFGSQNSGTEDQDPVKTPTFRKINEESPNADLVVLGGDLWHIDTDPTQGKRDMFKNMYSLNSPTGPYNDFVNLILKNYPLVHFFDDHDIGKDGADKLYMHRKQSYQVLDEFFPVYQLPTNPDGPNGEWRNGDWQRFSYGNTDFFILDNRSQRDRNQEPNGPAKSMLDGDNLGSIGQLEWLKNGLKTSTAKWKIIFSPMVFNTTFEKTDSWSSFKYERNYLVNFIKNNNIKGVAVISGDAHGGAIDNGTNSGVPEMLVPGPNMKKSCFTIGGNKSIGQWTQGIYGSNLASDGCRGYGIMRVMVNPDRLLFRVKDEYGNVKLSLRYFLNPSEAALYPNLVDE